MERPRRSNEPFYPILSIDELADQHDHRDELPLTTQDDLDAYDRVVHIVTPEVSQPTFSPSALREILRLTHVRRSADIGTKGPAVASLSSQRNETVAALRKFEVIHSRDSLEIALKLRGLYPELVASTIRSLATTQGIDREQFHEGVPFGQEEPGKIMLLTRDDDPLARKFSDRLNWGWPFYGSIDGTLTFISAIAHHFRKQNSLFLYETYIAKDGTRRTIGDALERSVEWTLGKLDENQEGLLEFRNLDPHGGMPAQAWKDSAFAYVHADGTRANHAQGIASIEVQALAYDALLDAAGVYGFTGRNGADELKERAEQLRTNILNTFWINEKGGYFALGTDRDESGKLRTLNVRSSNMGHLLHSRLLQDTTNERVHLMRDAIVNQLFTTEMLHYSGIRTLASDEIAFRPGGYHTGSVWLWDTAFIADGLEQHGFYHLAWELRARIGRTVESLGTFPEFVRGDIVDEVHINGSEIYVWNSQYDILHLFEQPPQEIQGWTVSAMLAAKRAYPHYLKERKQLPTSPLEQTILAHINRSI